MAAKRDKGSKRMVGKTSVNVFVRIRPEAPEASTYLKVTETGDVGISMDSGGGSSCTSSGFEGVFDHVFGKSSTQEDLYRACGQPLVDAVFDGFDACLFAYGQTGSGKTHTMLGPDGGNELALHELNGVIPQAGLEIFRRISRAEGDAARALGARGLSAFEVRARYVEVFQGRAYDLLRRGREELSVHERTAGRGPEALAAFGDGGSGELLFALGQSERVESGLGLLRLIRRGSANRATASTGQNEHSSRSHALLTLSVEHRWAVRAVGAVGAVGADGGAPGGAAAAGGAGEAAPAFRSRTARLVLVDLAGSENTSMAHGGAADRSGTSINLGLLAVGQVCAALAAGAAHVPYRNDLLTRLLQPALGGICRTVMVACVSDSPGSAAESTATLRFGRRVAGLRTTSSRVVDAAMALEAGPMDGDEEDTHPFLRRRTAWIETRSHGDIFARVCGSPGDPLVLYVHGSGPRNSSLQFNFCQDGLGRREPRLFQVSIDCPGYGRSPGDKQTVRSFAGPLLLDVVRSLGKSKAFCIAGSSQGACAVLNAALEEPEIAYYVAVCHPVGHDVARYTRIQQPVLLQFDSEDDGHPIAVGRRMRRNLPHSRWFEYAGSEVPGWLDDHMAQNLLDMFRAKEYEGRAPRLGSRAAAANSEKLPDLTRVAGGVHAWADANGREWEDRQIRLEDEEERAALAARGAVAGASEPVGKTVGARPLRESSRGGGMRIVEDSEYEGIEGRLEDLGAAASGAGTSTEEPTASVWRVRVDCGGPAHRIEYVCEATGEVRGSRPVGAVVLGKADKVDAPRRLEDLDQAPQLFRSDSDDEQREAELREAARAARAAELRERECHRCGGPLLLDPAPVRLPACRHVVCAPCVEIALRHHRSCPVCGLALQQAADALATDVELVAAIRLERGREEAKGDATDATVGANSGDEIPQAASGGGAGDGGSTSGPIAELSSEAGEPSVYGKALAAQRGRLREVEAANQLPFFVLEVGNDCSPGKAGKFTCTTFVRAATGMQKGGRASGGGTRRNIIRKVEFNINPSYAAPTERLMRPNGPRGQFQLERTLGFTYPCFATVHFLEGLRLAPLQVQYYTQVDRPRFSVRVVVVPPSKGGPPADPCCDGAGPDGEVRKPQGGARGGRGGAREYKVPKGVAAVYEAACGDGYVWYRGKSEARVRFVCPAGADREQAPGKLRRGGAARADD